MADIDLLNDETNFKNLIEALTNSEIDQALLKQRNEIEEFVGKQDDNSILASIKENIELFLKQLNNSEHTLDGARGALNRIRKEATKWSIQKEKGIEGFESGCQAKVKKFLDTLKSKKLFMHQQLHALENQKNLLMKKTPLIPYANMVYQSLQLKNI